MARRLTFLTRPGCGLCTDVLAKTSTIGRLLRVSVEVRDISVDSRLHDEYHLRIPVILDADGAVVAEGALTTWELLRVMTGVRR